MRYQQNRRRKPVRRGSYEFYGYGAAEEPVTQPGDIVISSEPEETAVVPVVEDEPAPTLLEVVWDNLRGEMPVSVGTQIFSIVAGAAGGLAGLVLGFKLSNATRMKSSEVIIASLVAAAGSFGAIYLIKTYR